MDIIKYFSKISISQLNLLFIFAILIIILASVSKKDKLPNGKLYEKNALMNKTEKILFYKLKEAFPECHIFAQVPFSCIVKAKSKRYKKRRMLFWKINQKRVDFLICDQNLESLFIVELDGSSHYNKKYYDNERDNFFKKNNINTIRFDVRELATLGTNEIIERCNADIVLNKNKLVVID